MNEWSRPKAQESGAAGTVLGIDGCRGGWAVAVRNPGVPLRLEHHEDLAAIVEAHADVKHGFIDMPIGLPEAEPRACDGLARRLLGRRASTIFPVPCRRAVYAEDYLRACAINQQCQGRRLSKQVWNLVPKIIEVDRLVQGMAGGPVLYESHPELCFAGLNGGVPLLSKKREIQGARERLQLLEAVEPGVWHAYTAARERLRPCGVMSDDIVDAMVLALSAARPLSEWRILPDPPECDGRGLPMRIVGPDG